MTEGQILQDAISVGRSNEGCLAQGAAAFGILGLEQMAPARAPSQDFAGSGYLETLGHCLPGFYSFGSSHIGSLFLFAVRIHDWVQAGQSEMFSARPLRPEL